MTFNGNMIFGVNPIVEQLRTAPQDIVEIISGHDALRPVLQRIKADAQRAGIKFVTVSARELNRMAEGGVHQSIAARIRSFQYGHFETLKKSLDRPQADLLLALDGLTDPRNFGAILRTAEAVGVKHVIVPKDRAVGVTPAAIKASAGAISHLNIYRVTNLRRAIFGSEKARVLGCWTGCPRSRCYDRIEYAAKIVAVLGGEGAGIRPSILQECDFRVHVPMLGNISSLNVSVAGAVFLYEVLRQRRLLTRPLVNDIT